MLVTEGAISQRRGGFKCRVLIHVVICDNEVTDMTMRMTPEQEQRKRSLELRRLTK
jgi:hypothetical protein